MNTDDLEQLEIWSAVPSEHRLAAAVEASLHGEDFEERKAELANCLVYPVRMPSSFGSDISPSSRSDISRSLLSSPAYRFRCWLPTGSPRTPQTMTRPM